MIGIQQFCLILNMEKLIENKKENNMERIDLILDIQYLIIIFGFVMLGFVLLIGYHFQKENDKLFKMIEELLENKKNK